MKILKEKVLTIDNKQYWKRREFSSGTTYEAEMFWIPYFELRNSDFKKNQNKDFNSFLNKNNFDPESLNSINMFQTDIRQYFKEVDKFSKLSEQYGEYQYLNHIWQCQSFSPNSQS